MEHQVGYVQVPLDEIANYPRFHEATGAVFRIAGSIFDSHGLLILAYGDRRISVVKSAGLPDGMLPEGAVIVNDSNLADLVARAYETGAFLESAPGPIDGLDATGIAVAPVVLSDYRQFGAVMAMPSADAGLGREHLDALRHLATLVAVVVESERRAMRDRLTGLYTRQMFDDHLELEVARVQRNGPGLAVLVAGFEFPDESPSHSELWWLAQVSGRLKDSIRDGDTAARVGPREFALLVSGVRDVEAARRVATALVELLVDPLPAGGRALVMVPSVGVALAPNDGVRPLQLFDGAVQAMHHARLTGGNRFAFFSDVRMMSLG